MLVDRGCWEYLGMLLLLRAFVVWQLYAWCGCGGWQMEPQQGFCFLPSLPATLADAAAAVSPWTGNACT
jgi:hypothetical protein